MTPDAVFSAANTIALLSWILLAALPQRRGVATWVTGAIAPLLLAVAYAILIVARFGRGSGGFSSLTAVAALFSDRWLLLAGWIHYLAFDLFVGSWEARDAAKHGIPHLLLVPCLILTFMLGPMGFALYLGVRFARTRRLSIE